MLRALFLSLIPLSAGFCDSHAPEEHILGPTIGQQIIPLFTIDDLLPHLEGKLERALVLMDVDEVSVYLARDGLDFYTLYDWTHSLSERLAHSLCVWALDTFPAHPIEDSTLSVFHFLKEHAKTFLYLTARYESYSQETLQHLEKFPRGHEIPNIAPDGILFTRHQCKGLALRNLSAMVPDLFTQAELIVFVDDQLRYLEAVAKVCRELHMPALCFHYQRPKRTFPGSIEAKVRELIAHDRQKLK